jgi:dipeptidyl aminopeptidase/acylaminoacyl peptidase
MCRYTCSLILLVATFPVMAPMAAPNVTALQVVDPLPVESAINLREFAEFAPVSVSPDGRRVAYTIKDERKIDTMDPKTHEQTDQARFWAGTEIWIQNLLTGEVIRITEGKGNNWLPVWSPDGHYVAYLSDLGNSGQTQLWIWDEATGETKRVSERGLRTYQIGWLPDSTRVVVTAPPRRDQHEGPAHEDSNYQDVEPSKLHPAPGSSVTVYEWRGDAESETKNSVSDPWNLDEHLRDLIAINIANGDVTTLVPDRRISWYRVAPDGGSVACTIPERFENPDSQQVLFDLVVVALGNREERTIAREIRLDLDGDAFSWSPTGQQLSFHAGGMDEKNFDCYVIDLPSCSLRDVTVFPTSPAPRRKSSTPLWDAYGHIYLVKDGNLWKADVRGGRATLVGRIPEREITQLISGTGNALWTVDRGKSTIVVTHDASAKQDGFFKIDLDNGHTAALLENGQCYTCFNSPQQITVTPDGRRVLYTAEDAEHPPDLWINDAEFDSPRRLTHLNTQFDAYKMGKARLLSWRSDDGEQLQGALLLPSDYREGARYPLIVWVYGGALLSDDLHHFGLASAGPFNMQLLATRGYAVLLPDAPLHLGTPLLDLEKTVLPGVDKAIELGIADPDRLAVIGHSFGGYSTLSLIVQTTRFEAAIEIGGPGNLLDIYGEMDQDGRAFGIPLLERGQGLMGGTPWQFRDRYIENSPAFYLDRIETPLLIVQGSKDRVVSPFLADEIFVELRRLGKEVEYAKYGSEGHSPPYWRYADQVDFCNRMIRWLDDHLKNRKRLAVMVPTK